MEDHLLMCGNKTDQCPNCRKFIRRAMFAYHYENGCADVDAIDKDVHPNIDNYVASSALQAKNLSKSADPQEKHISVLNVNLQQNSNKNSTTFQQSNSGRL
ncbi:unnamed protein product [Rotaria sp. Silwood1]|nr:unnamed protein product [Rotaria sp. Silwood1]